MGYALGMLLLTYFVVVVVIDVEHRLILHPTSIVGALIALGIGLWLQGIRPTLLGGLGGFGIMLLLYYLGVLFSKYRARRMRAAGMETDTEEALGWGDVILAGILGLVLGWPIIWFGLLLGILLGGGSLLLVAYAYQWLTGKEGMGGGDIKLLAMMGAFLGWRSILFIIFSASLVGSVIGITTMLIQKKDAKLAIPFGPFLAFGAVLYLFYGRQIIVWYLSIGRV